MKNLFTTTKHLSKAEILNLVTTGEGAHSAQYICTTLVKKFKKNRKINSLADAIDEDGNTIAHYACLTRRLDLLQYLDGHADFTRQNNNNDTVYHHWFKSKLYLERQQDNQSRLSRSTGRASQSSQSRQINQSDHKKPAWSPPLNADMPELLAKNQEQLYPLRFVTLDTVKHYHGTSYIPMLSSPVDSQDNTILHHLFLNTKLTAALVDTLQNRYGFEFVNALNRSNNKGLTPLQVALTRNKADVHETLMLMVKYFINKTVLALININPISGQLLLHQLFVGFNWSTVQARKRFDLLFKLPGLESYAWSLLRARNDQKQCLLDIALDEIAIDGERIDFVEWLLALREQSDEADNNDAAAERLPSDFAAQLFSNPETIVRSFVLLEKSPKLFLQVLALPGINVDLFHTLYLNEKGRPLWHAIMDCDAADFAAHQKVTIKAKAQKMTVPLLDVQFHMPRYLACLGELAKDYFADTSDGNLFQGFLLGSPKYPEKLKADYAALVECKTIKAACRQQLCGDALTSWLSQFVYDDVPATATRFVTLMMTVMSLSDISTELAKQFSHPEDMNALQLEFVLQGLDAIHNLSIPFNHDTHRDEVELRRADKPAYHAPIYREELLTVLMDNPQFRHWSVNAKLVLAHIGAEKIRNPDGIKYIMPTDAFDATLKELDEFCEANPPSAAVQAAIDADPDYFLDSDTDSDSEREYEDRSATAQQRPATGRGFAGTLFNVAAAPVKLVASSSVAAVDYLRGSASSSSGVSSSSAPSPIPEHTRASTPTNRK